jgi:preprotein translocase subunit SecD
MRRRLWVSLISTVVFVVLLFVGVVATGNTPILGLDLQGGVSVILAPVEPATDDDLIVIRDLIRSELENQGIAEPDVRVQGQAIVVDLPGVKDQQDAIDAVDVSGVVELRPVVNFTECSTTPVTPAAVPTETTETVVSVPDSTPTGDTSSDGTVSVDPAAAATTATTGVPTTLAVPGESVAPAGFRMAPAQTVPPTTIEPVTTGPAEIPLPNTPIVPSASGAELLPTRDGATVCVGPAQATGEVFERGSATVTADAGWGVAINLRGDGQAAWNSLANQCYNTAPTCPSTQPGVRGQIAITLDSVVQSAPQVNQPDFSDSVAITGSFTQGEADDLAAVLNRGAFPVEVVAQEARIISPSAGSDSLNAAVFAGIFGVLLVLGFMFLYYRSMAIVIVAGLTVWGLLVFGVASLVSTWTNYSLSLAGVTGIIVSIGVTVDSYVVFFERIKDEMRSGRSLKNGAPRSFSATWRTIWSANLVSMIGAVILFTLSVGSVRGFALYLGITAFCDLIICYTFTRPAVLLIAGSAFMRDRKVLGIKSAPSVPPGATTTPAVTS